MAHGFEFDKDPDAWPRRDWRAHQRTSRSWPFALFLVVLSVLAIAIFYTPLSQLISAYTQSKTAHAALPPPAEKLPVLSERAVLMQHKLSELLQTSVESKLNLLDQAIRNGQAGANELKLLQDMRAELQLLALYESTAIDATSTAASAAHALPLPDASDRVARELSELKNLVFVGMASVGVVTLLLGGCWLRFSLWERRLPNPQAARPTLPPKASR